MKNELLLAYPSLEKEWNFSKNGEIPNNISLYSKVRYYFNCDRCNGREYTISLKDWFRKKSHKSKICRHYHKNQIRRAKLGISLAKHSPQLMLEWDPTNEIDYNNINYGSEAVAKWICAKCNSYFKQKICKRCCEGVGCPYCAGKKVNLTNNLKINYPIL